MFNWSGVGLLDRSTGRLRRIPNPANRRLCSPVFNPAGTQLACLSGAAGHDLRGVALVDLSTGLVREVFGPASAVLGYPINNVLDVAVQPGTGHLLIARAPGLRAAYELLLLDPKQGVLQTILPQEESARYLRNIQFIGPAEIIFQLDRSFRGRIAAEVAPLESDHFGPVNCRLRFGKTPRLLVPELERSPNPPFDNGDMLSLAMARDGTVIGTSRRGVPGPGYATQVAQVDVAEQRLHYLTATPGVKNTVAIAADGGLVAFQSTDALVRGSAFFLWTLDRRDGALVRHDLLARLGADSHFFLPQ